MSTETTSSSKPGKKSLGLTLVVLALLVGYVFARPHVERHFNISLPHLVDSKNDKQQNQNEDAAQNKKPQLTDDNPHKESYPKKRTDQNSTRPPVKKTVIKKTNDNKVVTTTTPKPVTGKNPSTTTSKSTSKNRPRTTNMPVLGQLKKIKGNIYVSTAGLRYKPAGREHRIEHIMRHSKDQPNRPGPHGVFDGDRAEIFAVVDEAYLIGIKRGPPQAKIKKERGRTIYTVNMKRKIGYIGGQTGKRKKNPPVYYIRLVLEGKNVITAFPLKP